MNKKEKNKKFKEPKKWLKPRSIRFDREKLNKADKMGLLKELNKRCREALDQLIGL